MYKAMEVRHHNFTSKDKLFLGCQYLVVSVQSTGTWRPLETNLLRGF